MPEKFLPVFSSKLTGCHQGKPIYGSMRDFPQKKRDRFSLSITQAIANDPITQKHKDTHKKNIPVGSKANTGTKGFTAIVNTGENTNSTKV